MYDPINLKIYPISVTPLSGAPLTRLKQRLDLMERETRHLMTAVLDMRNGIRRNEINHDDRRLLADGLMASRGWALSVVMSHCYVQTMLGRGAGSSGYKGMAMTATFAQTQLWSRAVDVGIKDGERDRGG